jgi:hypothetical protein
MPTKKKDLDTATLCRTLCKWHVASEYEALIADLRSRPELEGYEGCAEHVSIMVTEERVSPEEAIRFLRQADLDVHQALILARKKRKMPASDPKGKKKIRMNQ